MPYANPDSLVSTGWLEDHLNAPDIRIVDATYYLPMQGKDARAEYNERHIPGAAFFDIDEIADTSVDLPHMLPSPEKFAARMRKLGLGDGNRIIVYDGHGMMSAARVWWEFRVFGHKDVAVLDGGLPKWLAEGRPLEDLPPKPLFAPDPPEGEPVRRPRPGSRGWASSSPAGRAPLSAARSATRSDRRSPRSEQSCSRI